MRGRSNINNRAGQHSAPIGFTSLEHNGSNISQCRAVIGANIKPWAPTSDEALMFFRPLVCVQVNACVTEPGAGKGVRRPGPAVRCSGLGDGVSTRAPPQCGRQWWVLSCWRFISGNSSRKNVLFVWWRVVLKRGNLSHLSFLYSKEHFTRRFCCLRSDNESIRARPFLF